MPYANEIHFLVPEYTGNNPRKREENLRRTNVARKMNRWIEQIVAEERYGVHTFGEIMSGAGIENDDKDIASELLYAVSYSSNGITIMKPKDSRAD